MNTQLLNNNQNGSPSLPSNDFVEAPLQIRNSDRSIDQNEYINQFSNYGWNQQHAPQLYDWASYNQAQENGENIQENKFAEQFIMDIPDNVQESSVEPIINPQQSQQNYNPTMYFSELPPNYYMPNLQMHSSNSTLLQNDGFLDGFRNSPEMESFAYQNSFTQYDGTDAFPFNNEIVPGFHFAPAAGPYNSNSDLSKESEMPGMNRILRHSSHDQRMMHPYLDPSPSAESKQLRRNRNRVSASRCRSKRKEWIHGMECKSSESQSRVEMVRNRINMLQEAISFSHMMNQMLQGQKQKL